MPEKIGQNEWYVSKEEQENIAKAKATLVPVQWKGDSKQRVRGVGEFEPGEIKEVTLEQKALIEGVGNPLFVTSGAELKTESDARRAAEMEIARKAAEAETAAKKVAEEEAKKQASKAAAKVKTGEEK